MNKIFYTLFFLLFFSFFNNNAKAQTSPDVVPCTLVGGLVDAAGQMLANATTSTGDQTCDTSGATNLTLELYNLGFCTAAPTIKHFNEAAKNADQRDRNDPSHQDFGASDFSNCIWTIKQSTTTNEVLDSVGDVEPLPVDEIPPAGTYTHAVILISNQQKITGTVSFAHDVNSDGTSLTKGTKCWTNGSFFIDTGKEGPLIGTSVLSAKANRSEGTPRGTNGNVRNGAECGNTPNPTANTVISYYSNHEPTGDVCASEITTGSADRKRTAGCNTTRSEESTSFGSLKVYFTFADTSTLTGTPNITRALIVSGQTDETVNNAPGNNNGNYGTGSNTNSLLGVFQFNTPMVVTSKTTGIEIYTNFSGALSVDFEPIQEGGTQKTNANAKNGSEIIYNKSTANGPRLKAIQTGPFGIQFKPVEGGSTE